MLRGRQHAADCAAAAARPLTHVLLCACPPAAAASCCRRMPFLKKVLDLPAFKAVINKVAPAGSSLPV